MSIDEHLEVGPALIHEKIEQYGKSAKNSRGGMAGVPSMQQVIRHYSKRTRGWKNLDPIIGFITDTTARVLDEFTKEQEVISAPSSPCRQACTGLATKARGSWTILVITTTTRGTRWSPGSDPVQFGMSAIFPLAGLRTLLISFMIMGYQGYMSNSKLMRRYMQRSRVFINVASGISEFKSGSRVTHWMEFRRNVDKTLLWFWPAFLVALLLTLLLMAQVQGSVSIGFPFDAKFIQVFLLLDVCDMVGWNIFLISGMLLEGWIDSVLMWCTLINPDVLFLRSRINLALWVSMDIIAFSAERLPGRCEYKKRCSGHTSTWAASTKLNNLTQETCTIGIRANRVTLNELLHARAFASAGAGGRPWSMIPSAASGQEHDSSAAAEEDDGFHDFVGPRQLVSSRLNGCRERSFSWESERSATRNFHFGQMGGSTRGF